MLEDTKLIQCGPLHTGSKVRFKEKPKVSFMDLITFPKRIFLMDPGARSRVQDGEGDTVEVVVMDVDKGEAGVGSCQTSS